MGPVTCEQMPSMVESQQQPAGQAAHAELLFLVNRLHAAGRPTVGISLAPSKTPTVKQQQQAAAARKQPQQLQQAGAGLHSQHSIDDALHYLHALQLSPRSSAAAAAAGVAASDASVHGSVYSEEPSEASAAGAKAKVPWRPLADYKLEPDLAK